MDDPLVRPLRTYLEGDVLKHPGDDPYPVSETRARDLERNGLVERAKPTTATAEAPQPSDPEPPRKGRPRAS